MSRDSIAETLERRFGEPVAVPAAIDRLETLGRISARRVHRRYLARPVGAQLVRLLCAVALCAPTKSDLQQRDIVVVDEPATRARIADLLPHMPWVREAPAFLVFCANGARVRQVAALRDKPFPNDHLDLFFNAVGDAAIALATCLHALESLGLGGCPISEIRNHAETVDALLGLPAGVLPFAGLCIGWPAGEGELSPRLPLKLTVHQDRYREPTDLAADIDRYDRHREALQPYQGQYQPERWGVKAEYGWSEQKARQYAVPQRTTFGAYVRAKGFTLE